MQQEMVDSLGRRASWEAVRPLRKNPVEVGSETTVPPSFLLLASLDEANYLPLLCFLATMANGHTGQETRERSHELRPSIPLLELVFFSLAWA